ncbi:hypothetical protein FISHEDRAFT_76751 [Fistulina hepatica ATCC 64428]|uniref:Uncharacterized protein n=1 Tax=Fistulina hepatica ATCC 64428 TaxID=1128425 RepID=A0A0D7A4D9_9AGAR|nr:hypothetical protein FISHEDRAFT_76751 [Fistulina hepatica ATCC 64428]
MTTKKTLSAGTMSLRFMQRAQTVAITQAKVKDEGEWTIPDSVRQSWASTSHLHKSKPASSESSYLPFLVPDEPTSSSAAEVPLPGRRKYAQGHIVKEEPPPELTVQPPIDDPDTASYAKKLKGSRASGGKDTMSIGRVASEKKSKVSVRQLLSKSSDIGTDLGRASVPVSVATAIPVQASTFLKPSGVDEPATKPFGVEHPPFSSPPPDSMSTTPTVLSIGKRERGPNGTPKESTKKRKT